MARILIFCSLFLISCSTNTDPLYLQVSSKNLEGVWLLETVSGGLAGGSSRTGSFNRLVIASDSTLAFYRDDTLIQSDSFIIGKMKSIFTHQMDEAIISINDRFEPLLVEKLTAQAMQLKQNCTDCFTFHFSRSMHSF